MTVTVQYYKYPRTPHWRHDLAYLGEDEHGVWLGAAPGTIVQRGEEPPITMQRAFTQLVPRERWWTAIFNDPLDARMAVYVDVTTVPSWPDDRRVEMVDLDLDVIKLHDGTVYIDDEDEFEEHRVALAYPPQLIDGARSATARLVVALEAGSPPFDGSSETWLARVSSGPP